MRKLLLIAGVLALAAISSVAYAENATLCPPDLIIKWNALVLYAKLANLTIPELPCPIEKICVGPYVGPHPLVGPGPYVGPHPLCPPEACILNCTQIMGVLNRTKISVIPPRVNVTVKHVFLPMVGVGELRKLNWSNAFEELKEARRRAKAEVEPKVEELLNKTVESSLAYMPPDYEGNFTRAHERALELALERLNNTLYRLQKVVDILRRVNATEAIPAVEHAMYRLNVTRQIVECVRNATVVGVPLKVGLVVGLLKMGNVTEAIDVLKSAIKERVIGLMIAKLARGEDVEKFEELIEKHLGKFFGLDKALKDVWAKVRELKGKAGEERKRLLSELKKEVEELKRKSEEATREARGGGRGCGCRG